MAYVSVTFVFGEQPSAAKWNLLGSNDAEFNSLIQRSGTGSILLDTNSNELLKGVAVASAVNEITATNAITATAPSLSATGGDTNIDLQLTPKGTGTLNIPSGVLANFAGVLGYSQATADQALSGGTEADLTNLSVAVTVPSGGRSLFIVGYVGEWAGSVSDQIASLRIKESSTQFGEMLQDIDRIDVPTAGSIVLARVSAPSAGAHTYKLTAQRSQGTGTLTMKATATIPAFILVLAI